MAVSVLFGAGVDEGYGGVGLVEVVGGDYYDSVEGAEEAGVGASVPVCGDFLGLFVSVFFGFGE